VLVKPAVRSQSSQSSARPTPANVITPAADRA
jgi:hypothetical protein